MGATLPSGDTAVANTWDEFQAIPSLVAGQSEHRILLSTDTSRYYNYDPADLTGSENGNPAQGWRVWNADSSAYVYRQNYSPEGDSTYAGGPLALQESHYRFNDAANGSPLMGLEITHSGLQWNYCYNEDFLFFVLEITNTSANDYADFAFGLYIDLDVGGPDGTGENGRLGDLVAVDSAENLAWIYDDQGFDPGWASRTGVMGTKLLETPDDIGLTAFRTGDFFLAPSTDEGRFAFINSTTFETSLPPTDQYYIQCVRGINLTAGKTVRVVWALIAGKNENDFLENAQRAQQFYDDQYVGSQPPETPTLTARAGDEVIYLSWDDTSHTSIDPRTGEAVFAGYKLYRSMDRGVTWGEIDEENDNLCLEEDYIPLARYSVGDPDDPIPHSYIDNGLHNDKEYWYCLAAYDRKDTVAGLDPLQSGFGVAGQSINVVAVTPRDDPAGLITIDSTVEHTTTNGADPSEGEVYPFIFESDYLAGTDYEVTFSDGLDASYWHLVNVTTGDTLLADQTQVTGDPGLYEIADGIRVVVRDADPIPPTKGQTSFSGADTTLLIVDVDSWWGVTPEVFFGDVLSNRSLRPTYEIRYTSNTTIASPINYGASLNITLPFEVWDTDAQVRVTAAIYDWDADGIYQPYDLIAIVNMPYEASTDPFAVADIWPYEFSWLFAWDESVYAPAIGDVYTIEGAPMNGPDDVFSFSADAVNSSLASEQLKDVKVVPNPYFVRYEAETNADVSFLKFSEVPDECTVRIYTLAGDLVRTLENTTGTGYVEWDLLSLNCQQVASGIYIYHIESPYGERLGRFAVIK